MKKLSALIALLLCVTVGGVYATWTYVNESTDIFDASKEVLVELEDATTDGAAGTFSITSNLGLKIDQVQYGAGEENLHEGKLVFYSTDSNSSEIYLTVTFTPSLNASSDIRDNAVPAELYFTTTTEMKYKADANGKLDKVNGTMKEIFEFSNFTDGVFTENITWTKNGNGTFSVTYNEAQLKSMIQLNGKLFLDTKADYDHFANEHLTGNISVHVTDGTVQTGGAQG